MDQEKNALSNAIIIKIIFAVASLALAFYLWDILIACFAAFVFAIALDKPIDVLHRRKIPRWIAAFLVYATILAVLGLALYVILPPLAFEVGSLAVTYIPKIGAFLQQGGEDGFQLFRVTLDSSEVFKHVSGAISGGAEVAFATLFNIFGGIGSFLVIASLALFLNIQEQGVRSYAHLFMPKANAEHSLALFHKMQEKTNAWLWGRIIISLLVSILIFLGLYVMHVPYALTLSALALLLNFIPFVGPVIAAVPALLFASSQSLSVVIGVLVLYVVVNQIIEGIVLTPLLMNKALQLSPFLLLVVLLIGAKIAGILGMIIAMPAAAILTIFFQEYRAAHTASINSPQS
ncbi:MAG: AI-2E family transporter [Patescibacteria group bacterium]|nr:AI-2E family transporter [Patescibacteria group bacterium]